VSWLYNDAIVVNAEFVVGRFKLLSSPHEFDSRQRRWTARTALSVTWTTPLGLELTVEQHVVGDALSSRAWREWRTPEQTADARLTSMIQHRGFELDPLVRFGNFVRVDWRSMLGQPSLHSSAFLTLNSIDGSGLVQVSSSWHASDEWTLGAQLQGYFGANDTEYGSVPERLRLGIFLLLNL